MTTCDSKFKHRQEQPTSLRQRSIESRKGARQGAFSAEYQVLMLRWSADVLGALHNASNEHAVTSSVAGPLCHTVNGERLAQWSSGEHGVRSSTRRLSGTKWQKQVKIGVELGVTIACKALINNDFPLFSPWCAVVPYGAHNPKVVGSNPAPATTKSRVPTRTWQSPHSAGFVVSGLRSNAGSTTLSMAEELVHRQGRCKAQRKSAIGATQKRNSMPLRVACG